MSRPQAGPAGLTVVIGVGNQFRHDDGVGPEVIGRLRGQVPGSVRLVLSDGEPAALIEEWAGAGLAVVIDAVLGSPPEPGRLHRLELDRGAGQVQLSPVSSHGLGLAEAIGLAGALGRMPGRLIVHAVEAADLSQGTGLSPAVAAAAGALTSAVLAEVSGAT